MSTLIVLLPPAAPGSTAEFRYVLSPDGRTSGRSGQAEAAALPVPRGAGAEIVAIAPARSVSWHRVQLPPGLRASSPRLRAALEGLLEEQVLDEPQALHFALAPQPEADGSRWVATCDRAWLHSCLQALEAAGRPAARVVPEFTPQASANLHVQGEADDPWAQLSDVNGVLTVPLSSANLPLLSPLPEDAGCTAEPAVVALAEQWLQRGVGVLPAHERWLLSAQSAWDLAQFDLARAGTARLRKRLGHAWGQLLGDPQWRPVRWGAVALALAHVIGINAWAWQERAALDAKRDAVRSTLTRTFPQVRVVVDAPVQMAREVAALQRATGAATGQDLEFMLAALAQALPAAHAINGLEFSAGTLRLRGLALTGEQEHAAIERLRPLGYTAQRQGDMWVLTLAGGRP